VKVLILGKGLVGGALISRLSQEPSYQVIGIGHNDCDLRDRTAVENLFAAEKPDIVILAAGIVGGIEKNLSSPAELIMENSRIILNVIEEALSSNIPRFINLVPACVYPADINRRMEPKDLFTAPMESSSLPYSTAKLAGVVMVGALRKQYGLNWVSLISTNLYGDDSAIESHKAHVIPALMTKFLVAKRDNLSEVQLLGDGSPVREFLHVEDLAEAVEVVIHKGQTQQEILNIAGSESISIKSLAELIKRVVQFKGEIVFKSDDKNGAPKKLLDGTKIQELAWSPTISLEEGLKRILRRIHN